MFNGVIPTCYGKLRLPRYGYSSGRALTLLLDMVEPQIMDIFEKYIKSFKNGYFIDIGAAADAWYSIKACNMNPNITVIAIEPLKTEYLYMVDNLRRCCPKGKVIPLKIAVGNTRGIINIEGEYVRCLPLDDIITVSYTHLTLPTN